MDALALIREAEDAGLQLSADGAQLVVRGPRSAEAIVRKLAECKADVLAALNPDWAADARQLLSTCPDPNLKCDLTDLFEETAAALEYTQGQTQQNAEMLAFGHLIFHLLRAGLDCPVVESTQESPPKPPE